MQELVSLPRVCWDGPATAEEQDCAVRALEGGQVLWLPRLAFEIRDAERVLFDPAVAAQAKNISLDPQTGVLRGSGTDGHSRQQLQAMVQRYADATAALVRALLPDYARGLHRGRASFRPIEIAGRATSWRKDDTRLHVDSFPSSPTRGRRILRVFSNVHPQGLPRRWRLGEPFEAVARRYLHALHRPQPGSAALLHWLGVTKLRRAPYDHHMLQLHDCMKSDPAYQDSAVQTTPEFPPGSTWIVFTDQVSHAAMSGQHALEQTFLLDVAAMRDPALAPLHVLERLLGRALA